ncbi:MAG TPA: DUF6272 family protein [Flavobacteriales bacterium]
MRVHLSEPFAEPGHPHLQEARSRLHSCPAAEVVFEHIGDVDHDTVARMVAAAEASDQVAFDGVMVRKRLVNIAMEALENIHHYAMMEHRHYSYALLVRDSRGYAMAFGNAVEAVTGALLINRLGIINQMDPEDLKEHYQKLLNNEGRSSQGGAGLGLLTIARRCAGPLLGRTVPIAPGAALFTLELRLDRSAAA